MGRTETRGETNRLEAFSDGVIAIAITLLILEVEVPHAAEGESLGAALAVQWPSYAAYVVSFLTIGIIWVNHHHLFSVIERTTNTFLILNVLFLMAVAALPWPTALLAEHIRDEANRPIATATYAGTMVAIALMFNVVWRYAARGHRLLAANADPDGVRRVNRSYLTGPVTYLATAVLAFVNAWVSLGIIAALALYWLIPGTGPTLDLLEEGEAPAGLPGMIDG